MVQVNDLHEHFEVSDSEVSRLQMMCLKRNWKLICCDTWSKYLKFLPEIQSGMLNAEAQFVST